jgi:large subunit ribosomal protein L21
MYALVDIKGKQYRAESGALLRIDHSPSEEGESLEFDNVLLVSGEDGVKVGTPYVDGARVRASVEGHVRDRKVVVFKYKKRKNYRRKRGHRQRYTLVRIEEIVGA